MLAVATGGLAMVGFLKRSMTASYCVLAVGESALAALGLARATKTACKISQVLVT